MISRQTLGMLIIFLLISAKAFSYDFKVDGLCYNILSDNTVELTWEAVKTPYTGNIVIPSDVNYNSKRYDVVAIGDYAMAKVNSVDDSSVKGWGGNSKLSSVSLPSTILTIGNYAFWGCSGLTSITIPNSVTSIGDWAFQGCSGLTSITIPNSVTSIGGGAFLWCDNLTSITIPNSVIIIGEWAFNGCSGLTSVISEIQNPFETKENVFFSGTYNKATLTVPKGKKSAYQSTNYWKKFSKIVESTLEANDDLGKVADVVDLGLSVKWASWNIGASKPEEYGSYFSWGETTPKTNYAWSTYKFGNPPSKYNSTDNKKTLDPSDDAAVVLWGGKWRMPTNDEEKELYQKCSWKYTELNGINGYQITGPSGNSIFLPAAGLYDGNDYVASANNRGWYWSSSSSRDSYALGLYFGSSDVYYSDVGHDKCDGHVIRPVYDDGSNQGQVTVTVKNYTREYGDANPTFEYTVSGGSLSGTPKITCSATKTSSVGIYTIKIEEGSVTNSNVTFVDGTLTVTKAPLTITAKSYTREKGEANPTFEVTYSGFKNGETEAVLTRKPTISCPATTSSKVGTYTITVSGAQAQNYNIYYINGTLTVTEENKVRFTKDGITYACATSTSSATVETVDNSLQIVEIPASVTYNGKTYQVISLTNGIFAGRTFDYVSLPSTITSIGYETFRNSTLGALIWNADCSLSSSVFSYVAMPVNSNFLLYVNSQSYAPSNVANVVVGSTARSITLVDAINTRFYCPKPFTAGTVSYTHTYRMETGGNGKGWETIALPFDVQRIEHKSKGVLTPFRNYQDEATQRPFWLYELGSSGFRKASVIKANTPYIISMPNDSKYDSKYILTGDVTFSASNATIKKTDNLEMPSSNGKRFVPAFSVVEKSSSIYALNVSNSLVYNSSSYDDGSRFISNLRQVYPFEAYMTSNSAMSKIISIEFEGGATGIDEVLITGEGRNVVKVYSLDGQLLINSNSADWKSHWQLLPAGVYIVNGRKLVKGTLK